MTSGSSTTGGRPGGNRFGGGDGGGARRTQVRFVAADPVLQCDPADGVDRSEARFLVR